MAKASTSGAQHTEVSEIAVLGASFARHLGADNRAPWRSRTAPRTGATEPPTRGRTGANKAGSLGTHQFASIENSPVAMAAPVDESRMTIA